ncbi:Transcriptional regulator, Xre family [hydrothermal vent metagenome]|uniref:Transcriptional regulator, Xre family n=1 Tax=hydrothermal vent metagenome TaxID=652676 RepID=A0A3B0ZMM9_9ZZZZ
MNIKQSFARALKKTRVSKGLTQEDFGEVSSRTYLSTLERALKSPTLEKIDVISKVMDIHPLTLLTLAYLDNVSLNSIKELHRKIGDEIASIESR